MSHHKNIVRIKAVHGALKELKADVVFVGGATVSLYADRAAEEVRPTDDVDVLIELWTRKSYAELEEKLREIGFTNDQESGIICRFKIHGITVDIMPTEGNVLGFSNKWYPEGYKNAVDYQIDEHLVKIFSAPYLIASKLAAFKNRGKNDGRTSSDFEDIVFVFENRFSIWDELTQCDEAVKEYLRKEFISFLNNPLFEEWVDTHAGYGSPPATYYILERLKEFVD